VSPETLRTALLGRGLARPILAYLPTVAIAVWAVYAVADLRQGDSLVGAAVSAASTILAAPPFLLVVPAVLFVPPMVLTVELVHRLGAGSGAGASSGSRVRRAALGAASWSAWVLFVAVTLAVASRLVLEPGMVALAMLLVGASGAGFALLAFTGRDARAGIILGLAALAVALLVILGSAWMAGRWGGPV
jgi:hypothetical protein